MPQIINIPQRKTIRRGQSINPPVIPEYKIVSEPEYSSNGEKLIIAKNINQTTITLDSTKNTKVIVKVLTSVRVLPDIGKIDEEWDELQLDWGACVQFHYVERNWYILSSDGLKIS